jgi:hypothetical protein
VTTETTTSQGYITADALKQTLSIAGQSYVDPDLGYSITAASRAIDELCNRFFYTDTADTTRIYTPHNRYWQSIDDLVSITTLATDTTGAMDYTQPWTQNTDYILEPINDPLRGWPYTSIVVNKLTGAVVFDPTIPASIQVTGRFGWAAVPQPIQIATSMIASRLIRQVRDAPFGVISFEGGAVRIGQMDPTVKMLVGPYMRHRIAVA